MQAHQQFYADKKRNMSVSLDKGDLLLLRREGLDCFKNSSLSAKRRPKYLVLLSILQVMGHVSYRIELLPNMTRSHDFFHVPKLKKYHRSELETGPLPIVEDADGEIEQEVARSLDNENKIRCLYYLLQFVGEPQSDASWFPKSELGHCKALIQDCENSPRGRYN